jgi:hypothetical protein
MTSKELYNVKGDHPIFARIDKYGLAEEVADELIKTLEYFHYENIKKEKFEKKC